MITGATDNSRLIELRTYSVSTGLSSQYGLSSNVNVDGVNPWLSQYTTFPYTIVYYLGGITFTDIVESDDPLTISSTTFNYEGQGISEPNFITGETYIKNPEKSKIISNPKIFDDVFIIRDNLSAFNKNYRLEYVRNLVDLTTYAGGKYFNIINNS